MTPNRAGWWYTQGGGMLRVESEIDDPTRLYVRREGGDRSLLDTDIGCTHVPSLEEYQALLAEVETLRAQVKEGQQ